ncbi:hypothetical protein [Fulvivirga ligni]|uniref:hypothetical protein n=1 Tax=Fulvivirga ligni TaxID=2904246 RepID=UPI001F28683F|nr:hypothetical protein [Fulvivirga ligni]UII24229.1 hypothetical protein LVD16_13490 [Fulvivirga ligni]
MKKQSGYKYQIEQELIKRNWEIIEIDSNHEWWDDEHWIIQFKHNSEIKFYLCFVVDPMFEGERNKGQGIYDIKASTDLLTSWNDSGTLIASISMTKRKFNIKLQEFILELENFKKGKTTAN